MRIQTASETLSFSNGMEEQTAAYYEEMARKFQKSEDLLNGFAKENGKFVKNIMRSYYSVISDALEGCFAFDIETDNWALDLDMPEDFSQAVAKAKAFEQKLIDYYDAAADHSMQLMADVPRQFKIVVKKRRNRIPKLEELG